MHNGTDALISMRNCIRLERLTFRAVLVEGYTNNAIASRLYLSPKTVRNYVSSIFTKLEVSDRSQAIVQAREAGLGTKGDLR